MKTKIQKWGNSLGVRLPKHIAEQKALKEGVGVSVLLKDDQIVIEPAKKATTLKTLLSKIDESNVHTETDWSAERGKEVW